MPPVLAAEVSVEAGRRASALSISPSFRSKSCPIDTDRTQTYNNWELNHVSVLQQVSTREQLFATERSK